MRKFLLFWLLIASFPAFAAQESVYDRVMKSGTLRCGYYVSAPYVIKDAATGKMSGIWYDYVEELGRWLGLKIDWAEETGYGDMVAAFDAHKIDAFCTGVWVNPSRSTVMDFVSPISYQLLYAYVRDGDTRFDKNIALINDPKIQVSCVDGEMSSIIPREDFPKSTQSCLPQLSALSDVYMNVTSGKADIVFTSPVAIAQFNKTNANKLRKVPTAYPIRIFPESLAVQRDQYEFRRMLDLATEFMVNTGKIDVILRKYQTSPDDFRHPIKPYEVSK